ncbi:MAG TPA: GMC family oxidoreductase N-terminal domain-containing protein [Gaiellaceae bacterium]|nr:GMC family oxidoreductase N-terminal domain-containing protein [Gaiellaceae bacterium]
MRGFDYVIVGAGSAGCVLASRLTEDPAASVLLLEAGGTDRRREIRVPAAFSRLYSSEVDWGYRTVPQPGLAGREVYFPRGKVLGGSSSINAQIAVRGHRADYDGWAGAGNVGWAWNDVLPYFERSAATRFTIAELRDPSLLTEAFLAAASEAGLPPARDLNAPEPEGVALSPVNQRRGRRWSVADGYLRPARSRANLTVLTGAQAIRIVLEDGRARAVELRLEGRAEAASARREVILCGGAINSPHLLMLSGIGPRDDLAAAGVEPAHDLPGVGQNLQDHLAAGLLTGTTGVKTLAAAKSPLNLARYLLLRRGPLTSNVAEAVGLVRTQPQLEAPDLELLFAPVLFVDEGLTQSEEHGLTIAAIGLQPASVGRVELRSADPLEPPGIDPGYLSDPHGEDLHVLLHGTRLARRILASRALAPYVTEELTPGDAAQSDDELAGQVRARAQTLYHPVGTCRMGTDAGAVVDPELRVRGIDGLRVVDASVIPRVPRGHTNWPTVMIAEKAADLVSGSPG